MLMRKFKKGLEITNFRRILSSNKYNHGGNLKRNDTFENFLNIK